MYDCIVYDCIVYDHIVYHCIVYDCIVGIFYSSVLTWGQLMELWVAWKQLCESLNKKMEKFEDGYTYFERYLKGVDGSYQKKGIFWGCLYFATYFALKGVLRSDDGSQGDHFNHLRFRIGNFNTVCMQKIKVMIFEMFIFSQDVNHTFTKICFWLFLTSAWLYFVHPSSVGQWRVL